MMRSVLLALMFSGSVFALSANAYAQTSPDTRQTDQSEEDWRKSKKKGGTSSEDIIDIIENTRSTGVGNGRGYSPIDALPEESRRHLMKERAKRMAQAGPNEPVDVSYKPSEAAKSDSDLQDDEKAAWEKMAQGMNGAPDQGLQGQQGQGQQSQQGQSSQQGQGQQKGGGSGSQGQQDGGQSSESSGQSGQSRSVMRGGSAESVSDIMARIKGLTPSHNGQGQSQQGQGSQGQQRSPSGFGQGPLSQGQQGQSQQGQSQQGQSQQGQSQQDQSQQGQSQSQQQSQNQGQQQSQTIAQSQQNGSSKSPSQSDSQKQADAQSQAQAAAKAEAANKAHALSHAPASPQSSSSTRTPEVISPLDRIKKVNQEQNRSGSRSSASDYLKKKE